MTEELDILKVQVDAWETVVEVQQHFNDIEMRIRSLLLTLIGVLLTIATGFAEHAASSSPSQVVTDIATSYTMTIALTLCFAFALLFGYMDRFWYHVYLKGAVKSGERLEDLILERSKKLKNGAEDLGIDLTHSISAHSHKGGRTTGNRLLLFYGAIAYISGAGAILTRNASNASWWWGSILSGVFLFCVWVRSHDA